MSEYVTKAEHEEFRRTLDERDKRQDKRIELLEENVKQLHTLTTSVEKLALNMETMCREQKKQGDRLEALEQKPVRRFDTASTIFWTAVITFLVTSVGSYIISML